MFVLSKIRKLKEAIKVAQRVFKDGGYTTINICTPKYGDIMCGKRVLITGGSSGIGLAIAKKLVETGASVVITGRDENKLKNAENTIDSQRCHSLVWDISDVSVINENIKRVENLLGGEIGTLVNNAGVAPSKFFGTTDEVEWSKIYDINLKGNFFLTQELVKVWKLSKSSGYRKILNISSQGGFVGATYPYRMAKWDVRGLTEGLGKLLIGDNIIVNGIAPGVVKTSMQDFSIQQGDNIFTSQNPVQRVCLPEEIAELALFLISDASNFIVGQTVICDGGYTLK